MFDLNNWMNLQKLNNRIKIVELVWIYGKNWCSKFFFFFLILLMTWLGRAPPNVHDFEISNATLTRFLDTFNWLVHHFFQISTGQNFKLFAMVPFQISLFNLYLFYIFKRQSWNGNLPNLTIHPFRGLASSLALVPFSDRCGISQSTSFGGQHTRWHIVWCPPLGGSTSSLAHWAFEAQCLALILFVMAQAPH